MSKFSDRLASAKDKLGLSTRAASDKAKRAGHRLSPNTVSIYTRPGHPEPDVETVKALAFAFSLPERELMDLAGMPARTAFEPHRDADLLTQPQRAAVNQIIQLLADGNRSSHAATYTPAAQESGTQGETHESKKIDHRGQPLPDLTQLGVGLAAGEGTRELDAQDKAAAERGEENQDEGDTR